MIDTISSLFEKRCEGKEACLRNNNGHLDLQRMRDSGYLLQNFALFVNAGKLSSLLTVEEGAVCKGDVGKLRALYRIGVRMLTLTWNYPNELGHPNLDHGKSAKAWAACREIRKAMQEGIPDVVVRHVRYITNVGRIEVLGLGSDFDGIDTNNDLLGAQSMGLLWETL